MATASVSGEETIVSSDELDRTLICQPCKEDGDRLSVVGYCVNCHEYLCQRCFEYHNVPSLTRKHLLLDKENMPDYDEFENELMCPEHKGEEIKYHCVTHSFVGCHICSFNHQKTCRNVKYIPEVSESMSYSEEFKTFNNKLSGIKDKCTELASYIKRQREIVRLNHDETTAAMKKFKREVLDLIENLEKEFCDKAAKVREEETLKLDQLTKESQKILMETEKISRTVESLQSKADKRSLYIKVQQSQDKLQQMEDNIQTFECKNKSKQIIFKANSDLSEMLKSSYGLGNLQIKGQIEKIEHLQDINMYTVNDSRTFHSLTSVLLPGDKLMVSDHGNKSIKLVNTKQNKVISDLKLPATPWGVCVISDTSVAVALYPKSKIVFVRTDPSLSFEREIQVNGSPYGIGYLDDKLVVSYADDNKVEIMDMQGTVIKTFETDDSGQALFNRPLNLMINPFNNHIYISNYNSNSVVCMTLDKKVVAEYKDNDLKRPLQATFDGIGNVYVCCSQSNNVHQITEDCKKVKVILTSAERMASPYSISYQENDGTLYIGQAIDNHMKVFRLT